ncbi:hypothetical protein CMI42_03625 [Candidatus Pacearchaeota archaeon]|nr:hypothetical protein [Candidatus Pacearchaeota archaeon]|tara:strand:+ start:286 stop:549 length:264 start_codon:yes stop_codon:yes gene_type:complete
MELTKEEFVTLYCVEYSWQTDPEKAAIGSDDNLERQEKLFMGLKEKGLLEIEFRDGKIYGAKLTNLGIQVLKDGRFKEYRDYADEFY